MPLAIVLAVASVLVYTWAVTHPEEARTLVADLKRRHRLRIARRQGPRLAEEVISQLRQEAVEHGWDTELVERIINEHREEIAWQLGLKEAARRLGKITPLERCH